MPRLPERAVRGFISGGHILKKLGFIGIGKMARHHAKAARHLGAEVVIASASSLDSPNWNEFPHENKTVLTDDFHAVLNSDVDGIVVCPSWHVIPEIAQEIFQSVKPMLIEKPLGLSVDDLQYVDRTFSRNKFVCFNRRHYSTVERLKQRISHGDLIAADVVISEHIFHHRKTTGDDVLPFLLEFTSIHTFDLINYLFGNVGPEFIYSNRTDKFCSYNGILTGEENVVIHINADDPSPIGIFCRFPGEYWSLSPLEKLSVYKGTEIRNEGTIRSFSPRMVETVDEDNTFKPGTLKQMFDFLNGHGKAFIEDNEKALKLIEDIREYAR